MRANPMTDARIEVAEQERALTELVAGILDEARRQGATAAEVSVGEDQGLTVSVRQRDLETVEFHRDRGFGITVYIGARKGSASTSDASPEAVRATVRAALGIARHTGEDPCSGLADPERIATSWPDLDLHHPWDAEPDDLRELALEMEAAGLDHDPRIVNSEGAHMSTQRACHVYGNTQGFLGATSATRHGGTCVMIARDEQGMQRDYWYSVARDADDLEGHISVGEQAAERALARLGARPVTTGAWPVLFTPRMAAGLLGHLIGAISGGALYRRASYLLDALGREVAPEFLTLAEQPHLPKAIGSAGFDGDGVQTGAKAFVENGRLASYVLDTYAARRLGMETTGNAGGVFNLGVECDKVPVDALMQDMGTGLIVTELMGQGVNLVSGDYSRGAAGFWLEDGKPAFPVDQITIASNLDTMLRGIAAVGDDVDTRGNIRTGSILVRSMTVAA